MADLLENLLTQTQGSQRLASDGSGPKPKSRRTVAQIINETEPLRPSLAQGNGDHCPLPMSGPPQILRLKHVLAITAIGKTQLLDAVAKGLFPRPVKLLETGRSVGWLASEVAEYLERRIAARDQTLPRSDAQTAQSLCPPPLTT
jgi:prophage regulatory protein